MSEKHYVATWKIDVFASSPEEAAREAMRLKNKHDKDRIDNFFTIKDVETQEQVDIDLDEIDGRV
jgi:hypothetical protein